MTRPTLFRAALVAGVLLGSACQPAHLQFHNDHRLSFLTPKARARVTTPVTFRWSMKGFAASGLDGRSDKTRGVFAVFVDAAPMPVGKDLKWIGRSDPGCKRDPRCPDAPYLANRGVHVTTKTALRLSVLPRSAEGGVGDEQHFVNIVLLDGTGRRIGESAWFRPFTTKRRSS